MSQMHFEKWVEPMKAIAELNMKTLQEFTFLKPNEFTSLKSPEAILEKQIHIALDNGSKMVEHIQKSYQIMEKAMLSMITETKKATK